MLLVGCNANKRLTTISSPLYLHSPSLVKYDTLDAIFFYENLISSYQEEDVILKGGGFVKNDTITEESYYNGYYVSNAYTYVKHLKQKGINIRYDDASIGAFHDSLFQKGLRDGNYRSKTNINPFCGAYYKKYQMKVEVLYIDTVSQRTPLFTNCNEYEVYVHKNNGKNYMMFALPTYVITRVFSWEEL